MDTHVNPSDDQRTNPEDSQQSTLHGYIPSSQPNPYLKDDEDNAFDNDERAAVDSLDTTAVHPPIDPIPEWEPVEEPIRVAPEPPRSTHWTSAGLVASVAIFSFVLGGVMARLTGKAIDPNSTTATVTESQALYQTEATPETRSAPTQQYQPLHTEEELESETQQQQQQQPTNTRETTNVDDDATNTYIEDYQQLLEQYYRGQPQGDNSTTYDMDQTQNDRKTTDKQQPTHRWDRDSEDDYSTTYDRTQDTHTYTFDYDGYTYLIDLDELLGQSPYGDSESLREQDDNAWGYRNDYGYGYGYGTGYDTEEDRDQNEWGSPRTMDMFSYGNGSYSA